MRCAPGGSRWRIWLLLALLALAGCSTLPLLYKRGPTLAYWWLDSYLDLTDAQQAHTRAALRDWFAWHRRTQLVDYADALAALRVDATHELSATQICALNDTIRGHFRDGLAQALPAFTTLATSLDARQRRLLVERYTESNAELRDEELDGTPTARSKRTAGEAIDAAQDLYGRLTRAQKHLITQRITASPYDAERWLAEREARQRDTLAALERVAALPGAGRHEAAMAILASLGESFTTSPRAAYANYRASLTTYNCAFIAEVHNGASPAQRTKALRKLHRWETDLRQLMSD